jgi:hypothetical protein
MSKRKRQNPVAVAMRKRHGGTGTKMKDRRAPRGGSCNKERKYREDGY